MTALNQYYEGELERSAFEAIDKHFRAFLVGKVMKINTDVQIASCQVSALVNGSTKLLLFES